LIAVGISKWVNRAGAGGGRRVDLAEVNEKGGDFFGFEAELF
jgi:hypothetical protein